MFEFRKICTFAAAHSARSMVTISEAEPITEELPFGGTVVWMLFVIWNAVFVDERQEIRGRESCQCGAAKIRIVGEEILRGAMQIREIAAAAAGDQDFFAGFVGAFEDGDSRAESAGFRGAKQACRAGPNDDCVKFHLTAHGLPSTRNLLG